MHFIKHGGCELRPYANSGSCLICPRDIVVQLLFVKDNGISIMISIIVAVSKNNIIGNNGMIPWKIKGEQSRFRELTIGKTIIMGRRTFQEIGKPLPDRKTIVISNTENIIAEHCITVKSLAEALDLAKYEEEVFIAGGGQVYKEALPYTNRIYMTIIDKFIEGNVSFPEIKEDDFIKTYEKRIEGEIPYTYLTFERVEPLST